MKNAQELLDIAGHIEQERKFTVEVVGALPECDTTDIWQTYLLPEDGVEPRLRKRGTPGHWTYYLTTKQQISTDQRWETEKEISEKDYLEQLQKANPDKQTIHKVRRCFMYKNLCFELDTFLTPALPHPMLEIEGVADEAQIQFPPCLKILEDVTENEQYYNINIAKKQISK